MVVMMEQPELEAVLPPGSRCVLQRNTACQVFGITLLRRPAHRQLGAATGRVGHAIP